MAISDDFADDLLPQKRGLSPTFADEVLGKPEIKEPEAKKPESMFPFMPHPGTPEEIIRKWGVDPQSPTLAEDLREAGMPKAQRDRFVIGAGKAFKSMGYGAQQRALEAQQLWERVGIPLIGEPAKPNYLSPELQRFTAQKTHELEQYQKSPLGQSTGAKIGEFVGETAPYMAIPFSPKGITGATAGGATFGGLSGLTTFTPEGESTSKMIGDKIRTGAGYGFTFGLAGRVLQLGLGRGAIKQHKEIRSMLDDIKTGKKAGLDVEDLMVHQEAPEDMIIGGLGRQAVSTSKYGQHKFVRQVTGAARALQASKRSSMSDLAAGKVTLSEVDRAYNAQRNILTRQIPAPTKERAGAALQKGIADDFITKTKGRMRELYTKADDAALKEAPSFDLTDAKDTTTKIKTAVMGKTAEGTINVATPTGRLVGILDDIEKLSPDQADYEVIKQLRTRTGDLIEDWPWDSEFNKGQAKLLYRSLSGSLNNPTSHAPQFKRAIKNATSFARARFEVMDKQTIQNIIKADNPYKLYERFRAPGELTAEVRGALRKYAPDKLPAFRNRVQQDILTDPKGAVKALENWRDVHPESFGFVFPKGEYKKLAEVAKKMDELNASNVGQLFRSQSRAKTAIQDLLTIRGTSTDEINHTINVMGGYGSKGHKAMIAGIYEDFLDKTVIRGEYGVSVINKQKFNDLVKQYKSSGAWQLLPEEHQMRLKGLDAYVTLLEKGMDPGVALERAQAIAQLKRPETFIAGVHKLTVNEILARVLAHKGTKTFLLGKGKDPSKLPGYLAARSGLIVDALREDAEPTD